MANRVNGGKTTKVRLADLLGREGRPNDDLLYRDDPARRKNHVAYRAPRNRLRYLTPAGAEYRPLAGDIERDIKLNELAREYVVNGFRKTRAVAAVFGIPLKKARGSKYMDIFHSAWFRSKVAMMVMGTDGKLVEDLSKEYLVTKLVNILEMNILDYVGNEGRWLTVEELKAMPLEMQVMLDDFRMVNTIQQVALRDAAGAIVKDEAGQPYMVEHRDQVVHLKLPDKLRSMEMLGRAMDWIKQNTDVSFNFFDANVLVEAEGRVKKLWRSSDEETVVQQQEEHAPD